MKHPGIPKQTPQAQGAAVNLMAKVMKGEPVKMRKKRKKETKPRNQVEAAFRKEVVAYLRKRGFMVKRIENAICGRLGNGIPDLLFFTKHEMIWLELKSDKGYLRLEQSEFKSHCEDVRIKYVVARTMEDIEKCLNANATNAR